MLSLQEKRDMAHDLAENARAEAARATEAGFHGLASLLEMAYVEAAWIEAMLADARSEADIDLGASVRYGMPRNLDRDSGF